MKRLLVLLIASLVAIASAAEPNTVTVTGVGTVPQASDGAWINVGVSTEHPDISHAMAEMDAIIAAITDAVLDFDIPRTDIRTAYFNLWQTESYDSSKPRMVFYANHSLSILISDIDMLSYVVEAAIQAGANSINGIDFIVANASESLSEARKLAMEDARDAAAELAELSGYTLGRVISVRESNPDAILAYDRMYARGDSYGFEPGQENIRAVLEVVFELLDE